MYIKLIDPEVPIEEYIENNPNWIEKSFYSRLPRFNKNEATKSLKDKINYIRHLNVRHPFARLYSAWKDKFNMYNPDRTQIGRELRDFLHF